MKHKLLLLSMISAPCMSARLEEQAKPLSSNEQQEETTDNSQHVQSTTNTSTESSQESVDVDAIVEKVITTVNTKTEADPAVLSTSLGGKIASVVLSHTEKLPTTAKISAYLGLAHIVGIIIMRIVQKIKQRKIAKLNQHKTEPKESHDFN